MNIQITGHQIDLTEAINTFVTEKFAKLVRHVERITDIVVVLGVEKLIQTAEATIHVPGDTIHAKADGDDVYSAVDKLIDKLDKQLKKYKEKLTAH
jgi:putative sigma-54 modulation protein